MPNQQEIDKDQDTPLSTKEIPPPAGVHPATEEAADDAECQSGDDEDDFDDTFDDDFDEGLDEDEDDGKIKNI